MKYPDGQEVRLGDRVKMCPNDIGIVVASMDTVEYSAEEPKEQWGYLKEGVMIKFPTTGLVHYTEKYNETLELVSRAPQQDSQ